MTTDGPQFISVNLYNTVIIDRHCKNLSFQVQYLRRTVCIILYCTVLYLINSCNVYLLYIFLPFIFHKCGIYKCTCWEITKISFWLHVLRVGVFGSWWPKRRRLYAYGLGSYYWIKHNNNVFLHFLFTFQIPIENRNSTQLMMALLWP